MSADRKVAVVTGAATGIGRAIALRLAQDGYSVALGDLPRAREGLDGVVNQIGMKVKVKAFEVDVAKEDEVQALVRGAVEAFGGIDVFVANAGVMSTGSIAEITAEEWNRVFSVNVNGAMFCYKHAAKQMIAQGRGGRIIGACSVGGKRGFANTSTYCASKFAVRGLTQCAASDLAKFGITVNCYAPGLVDTSMLAAANRDYGKAVGMSPEEYRTNVVNNIPTGRVGQPEEIAGLVSYLVSPQAEYITGQCVTIDGGMHFD